MFRVRQPRSTKASLLLKRPCTSQAANPLDDGAYHAAFSDFRFDVRYNVAKKGMVLTPFVGAIVPSHDYAYFAHAAPGRNLHELPRSYERNASERIDRTRARDWEIVNLAARVLDDVPGERPRILQRLQKEFARSEGS